jgi:hypothetical protein
MAKTIRTRYYLLGNNITDSHAYEKQIYIKNASWNPPPAPLLTEDSITEFEKCLKTLHQQISQKHTHKKLTILNPLQTKT